MSRITAIIFDLDGVLADSEPWWNQIDAKLLAEYGYGIEVNSEYDVATRDVVAAFQRHFRPERVDGTFDANGRVVAKTITVDGDDLETAEMIQSATLKFRFPQLWSAEPLSQLERELERYGRVAQAIGALRQRTAR